MFIDHLTTAKNIL